jgi:hypothetical protein
VALALALLLAGVASTPAQAGWVCEAGKPKWQGPPAKNYHPWAGDKTPVVNLRPQARDDPCRRLLKRSRRTAKNGAPFLFLQNLAKTFSYFQEYENVLFYFKN